MDITYGTTRTESEWSSRAKYVIIGLTLQSIKKYSGSKNGSSHLPAANVSSLGALICRACGACLIELVAKYRRMKYSSFTPALLHCSSMKLMVSPQMNSILKTAVTYSSPYPNSKYLKGHMLLSVLQSCGNISQVSQVHGHMVKTGFDSSRFFLSKLLASSIKDVNYAASVFYSVQNPNLYMYNTMLRCYSVSDRPQEAFRLFGCLRVSGCDLDQFSYITMIKSSARTLAVQIGSSVHGAVVKSGFDLFVNVRNALMHFYCVCWEVVDAHQLFHELPERNDLVSWNTVMRGCLSISKPQCVVDLFGRLLCANLRCNVNTVVNLLSAFGEMRNHYGGETVHGYCIKIGVSLELEVVTALISMYGKTGYIDSGHRVFNEISVKDLIIWNCLIDAYAKNGNLKESLSLLRLMKLEGVKPNSSTVAGLLSASAGCEAGAIGQCVADFMEKEQLQLDSVVGTALLDMYSKSGSLEKAIDVFNVMESKDVQTWTAMISAYGAHGRAKTAVGLLYKMEEEGYQANEVTFLSVLSACSHGGLVEEGMNCIDRMVRLYGMAPQVEHYGCLIDLLGRAGLLGHALNFITSLPIVVDATVWRALLAACKLHGNVELAEQVKRILAERYDEHPTDSILLSNTYAMAGGLPYDNRMWQKIREQTKLEEHRENKIENVVKEVGCSSIEVAGGG